jgi:hypothetical protein
MAAKETLRAYALGCFAWLALALSTPAAAGGGAHVVDDDAVLDPGVCHIENWLTRFGSGADLVTAAPACTLQAVPRLELAAAVQHGWDRDMATSITPSAKLNLRSAGDAPVGVAVSAAAIWNAGTGRVEEVQITVPVSARATPRLILHANAGWVIVPGSADRHALFWGGQAEYALTPHLVLMGEVFGRDRGPVGAQTGLRLTMDRGRIDLDLLGGHATDGTRASAVTLGLTIRR